MTTTPSREPGSPAILGRRPGQVIAPYVPAPHPARLIACLDCDAIGTTGRRCRHCGERLHDIRRTIEGK